MLKPQKRLQNRIPVFQPVLDQNNYMLVDGAGEKSFS